MVELLKTYRAWPSADLRRDEGQALVEYALILFLIALVCIGVLTALGTKTAGVLQQVVNGL